EAVFLSRTAGRLGYDLTLSTLTGAAPGHAVLAVARRRGGPDRPLWTVAGGLSAADALLTALRDVVGLAQVRHFEGSDADLGDPLYPDFDPRVPLPAAANQDEHAVRAAWTVDD